MSLLYHIAVIIISQSYFELSIKRPLQLKTSIYINKKVNYSHAYYAIFQMCDR